MSENSSTPDDDVKTKTVPDHWSLCLRCTICFNLLNDPHTLECGHTFCKRCLRRLAETTRDDNPDVRLRRLFLSCPTCRHLLPAKPLLTARVRTCIVLKHLVDLWRRECKFLLNFSPRHFRSICSQTEADAQKMPPGCRHSCRAQLTNPQLREEFFLRTCADEAYLESLMRHVVDTTDELNQDQADGPSHKSSLIQAINATDNDRRHTNASSDSDSASSSSADEAGTGGSGENLNGAVAVGTANGPRERGNTPNASIHHLSISAVFRSADSFPVRLLLIGVWFLYSLLIVALAEAFLPYVIIFTMFFFLLILK